MKWKDGGAAISGNGPFTAAIWRPTSGTFSQFNGLTPDKVWNFCTIDSATYDTGTFYYWGLTIKSDIGVAPPLLPPCLPTSLAVSNVGTNVQISWNGLLTNNGNPVTFNVQVKAKDNSWITLTSSTNQLIIPMSNFFNATFGYLDADGGNFIKTKV